jgi:hypothetical protein
MTKKGAIVMTLFPIVIPNPAFGGVRNLELGIWREAATNEEEIPRR